MLNCYNKYIPSYIIAHHNRILILAHVQGRCWCLQGGFSPHNDLGIWISSIVSLPSTGTWLKLAASCQVLSLLKVPTQKWCSPFTLSFPGSPPCHLTHHWGGETERCLLDMLLLKWKEETVVSTTFLWIFLFLKVISHSSGDESFCSIHLVESHSGFSVFIFWPNAESSLGKLSDSF